MPKEKEIKDISKGRNKFFKGRLVAYGLVFFILLELLVLNTQYLITFYCLAALFSLYIGRKLGGKWLFSILPLVLAQGSTGLLYLIDNFYQSQFFIAISTFFFYLSLLSIEKLKEKSDSRYGQGINAAASTAAIFFAYSFVYGFYLNFLIPIWLLMLVYLIITFLVSYQFLFISAKEKNKAFIYSFIVSFSLAEIIWAINFWPFGYLTSGVVALILYYILWDIARSHFNNRLSQKKLVYSMVFFSLIIAIVLTSSKWLPVV